MQGGCGQFGVAVDHDPAGHLERRPCRGVTFSQPHLQALESRFEGYGLPPRYKGYGFGILRRSRLDLTPYGDADYADKSNDRRSLSGIVNTLGCGTCQFGK